MPATQNRQCYVYILTNSARTLYVGVTNDLERRMYEHKNKLVPGFASKYNVTWQAYYEQTSDVESAIAREKEIKGLASQQEDRARGVAKPTVERHFVGIAITFLTRRLDSSLRIGMTGRFLTHRFALRTF